MIDFILDLLPNDDYFYIYYLAGFFIISSLFIFYIAHKFKSAPKTTSAAPKKRDLTIDDLLKMVSNPKASAADILVALQLYAEKFKVENDVGKSMEFFKKALNHKNRSKNAFDFFHGTILPANLKYKDQLDKLEREALNNTP